MWILRNNEESILIASCWLELNCITGTTLNIIVINWVKETIAMLLWPDRYRLVRIRSFKLLCHGIQVEDIV